MDILTKRQINRLGKMYNVMVDVHNNGEKFDQNDVRFCIIGHSIKAGLFGKKIQEIYQTRGQLTYPSDSFDLPQNYHWYLFDTSTYIPTYGERIGVSYVKRTTALHAAKRIETILNLHGYDLV